jgi:hypothetical protein
MANGFQHLIAGIGNGRGATIKGFGQLGLGRGGINYSNFYPAPGKPNGQGKANHSAARNYGIKRLFVFGLFGHGFT